MLDQNWDMRSYILTHQHTCTHMYTHYAHADIRKNTHTHTQTLILTHTHTLTHTNTNTHTNTLTHRHAHAHARTASSCQPDHTWHRWCFVINHWLELLCLNTSVLQQQQHLQSGCPHLYVHCHRRKQFWRLCVSHTAKVLLVLCQFC